MASYGFIWLMVFLVIMVYCSPWFFYFQVRDEEGRRRFHGAFTGGYSAGYYNSVGSKEGIVIITLRLDAPLYSDILVFKIMSTNAQGGHHSRLYHPGRTELK